jgi:NADH-quinone oxidoreductase subunit L
VGDVVAGLLVTDYIWLIPLFPAVGAAVNGLLGIRWFGHRSAAGVACAAMAAAFGASLWAFAHLLSLPVEARAVETVLATWIPPIPQVTAQGVASFTVDWALRLDPLSSVMILVVTGIGLLIHVYSTAYMHSEPRAAYARFFCYLNLFCALMLLLVLGANFLVMFVGWEGVGLCSYLLIGFWYEKRSAADAGKKAFIVNRIGDWGFLLGIFLVFMTFGTVDFRAIADAAATMPVEQAGQGLGPLTLICLLLFVGATGKSAQIPLHVWLPDAMEGPTPVSALIHAATMVTAGVYMVARNAVLFSHAPLVMELVAVVGAVTALLAATIGLVQNDIKRVLAYSTVSQLGYMFLATGVGAFAAAVFHLVTHAFFKALLFLGSGAVIHAVGGEQDLQRMGGLRRHLPVTFATMTLGALAIAGMPPLAGFFSKDEILYRTFLGSIPLWSIAVVTALLTAFYMFRLMVLAFEGTYRGGGHPHEAPRAMTLPLVVLAAGTLLVGAVGIPKALGGSLAIEHFLHPSFTATHDLAGLASASEGPVPEHAAVEGSHVPVWGELGLMGVSVLVALTGILAAREVYLRRPGLPAEVAERWRAAYGLLLNKYYVDELYDATIVRGATASARGLHLFDVHAVDGVVNGTGWMTRVAAWISHMLDKYVVDGLVNLLGWSASQGSHAFRRVQTGLMQNYALVMLAGVFVFLTVYLLAR